MDQEHVESVEVEETSHNPTNDVEPEYAPETENYNEGEEEQQEYAEGEGEEYGEADAEQEEGVEDAGEEEQNGAVEVEYEVDVEADGEEVQEGEEAAAAGEGALIVPEEDSILYPSVFKSEVGRIDDGKYVVLRLMASIEYAMENPWREIGLLDLLADTREEENSLFSEVPEDVQRMLAKRKKLTQDYNKTVQSHISRDRDPSEPRSTFKGHFEPGKTAPKRLVIKMDEPLGPTYSRERHTMNNRSRQQPGHYHGLFYKDGEPVVFTPPEQNRRKEIEDAKRAAYVPPPRQKKDETPYSIPKKRVSKTFTPNCAIVDHSQQQERVKSIRAERQNGKPSFRV